MTWAKWCAPNILLKINSPGENKHDTLTYVMSAKTIKNHVKEGLELAREYKVPKIVRDFIPMHHGTTRVEYFYRKALENAEDPLKVDKKAFQYPGPKPNTKETGILMLCTFGGFMIWTMVDLIVILTGGFKDSKGKSLK